MTRHSTAGSARAREGEAEQATGARWAVKMGRASGLGCTKRKKERGKEIWTSWAGLAGKQKRGKEKGRGGLGWAETREREKGFAFV